MRWRNTPLSSWLHAPRIRVWSTLLGVLLLALWPWWTSPTALPYARSSDLFRHYLPFKEALHRLHEGSWHLPGWNPYLLGGQPLVADPGSGALYPFGVLFYLLPPTAQFVGFFGAHILLGVLLAYGLARRLGAGRSASGLAGLAYGLNLKLVGSWYAGFATMIVAQGWLPGAFWGLVVLRQSTSWRSWLAGVLGLGLSLGFQILGGDTQLMLYTTLGVGLMAGLVPLEASPVTVHPTRSPLVRAKLWLGLGLAGGLALLLALPLLFPASALTRASVRAEGVSPAVAMQMNVPPAHLPALVVPAFSGQDVTQTWRGPDAFWETSFGPGVLVWLLALLALGRGAEDLRLRRLWACAGLVLLASFGGAGPLYPLLYYLVPGVDHFRGPARLLPLLGLILGLLAALELDARTRSHPHARTLARGAGGLALLWAGMLLLLLLQKDTLPLALESHIRGAVSLEGGGSRAWQELLRGIGVQLVGLVVLMGGVWKVLQSPGGLERFGGALRWGLLVLVGLELSLQATPHLETRRDEQWLPPHRLAQVLASGHGRTPSAVPERILDLSGALPDAVAVRYGLHLVNGLNPLVLARSYTFMQYLQGEKPEVPTDRPLYGLLVFGLKHPALLDLLRVRTVVREPAPSPTNTEGLVGYQVLPPVGPVEVFQQFRGMAHYPTLERLERVGQLPLAWLVRQWAPAPADAVSRLDWLTKLDLFRSVLLELPPWEAEAPELRLPLPPTPLEGLPRRSEGTENPAGLDTLSWKPERITLQAEVPAGGAVMVLSEMLTPGWQVWVDGQQKTPLLGQHLLRAVWLEEGHHEVVWQYQLWPGLGR